MALKVVEDASEFSADMSRATVVIESDIGPPFAEAFYELEGNDTVNLAQSYAATKGCAPAYLNGNKDGPYAVNSEGRTLDSVTDNKGKPLSPMHARMQPAKYRMSIPLSKPFR